ncbi:ECF transporter S component [Streptococcus hillyeri]|uniref:ECF transporter S component n=1 Tax=Streptococcus hillyeri TaxID=2282420 RepID=A0A3L9DRC1_9STRE|nr:ECF transporter S component [Streptococcus hillyeri]RLY02768.1 ECF transporter S component [Streptococcus hillyeri]
MRQTKTKQLTLLAILTALTVVLGLFVKIPTVKGVTTLLDAGIFFAAFHLGKKEGAIVGGLSGFLFDLIAGYPQWMFISLVAHGGQGYLAGFTGKKRYLGILSSVIVMVATYFVASSVMYDVTAATADIITNILQNVVGILVGLTLVKAVEQVK